ncbi:hypothetical protein N9B94_01785 [Verrucomicrobia bacterium]|nr:hypothetical protein [Verrucomicrobiota bacterium]
MTLLAYLDPGTGSLIIQAAIAFFCGIAFTLKVYWHKVKGFFAGKDKNSTTSNEDTTDGK